MAPMKVPPVRVGMKKFIYDADPSKQPFWFKQTYYETYPSLPDWMTWEISQDMLERPSVEGETPKLTQIGRRVKIGMWERVRRGSQGYPDLKQSCNDKGMFGKDLPYDSFTHSEQIEVIRAFALADGRCPVVGCGNQPYSQ